MLIRRAERFRYSDVTPYSLYLNRRSFMGLGLRGGLIAGAAALGLSPLDARAATPKGQALAAQKNAALSLAEPPTSFESATTYNNFYEFGTDKEDPARLGGSLRTRPWSVKVEGLCAKPRAFDIEELLKLAPLEERVYSLRCVEAWSMVIPWIGYSLSALLKKVEPDQRGQVRRVRHAARRRAVPRPEEGRVRLGRARLALYRGAAHRRGHAPAHPADRWACTARCCPTRTARRCAWSSPGSTDSRAARASCASGSPASSRRRRGRRRRPASTASTPT